MSKSYFDQTPEVEAIVTIRKSILAAAVGLALSAGAQADLISFDPDGNGVAPLTGVALFDWAPGSALAAGAVPLTAVGQTFDLYYQANLGTIQDASTQSLFTNGGGGTYFTAVAGFTEVVTSLSASGATFALAAAPTVNFFRICAHSSLANNLTGAGFACANPILSGKLTSVDSSNFSISSVTPVLLDQSPNGNQWGTQQSVTGSGATSMTVKIESADTGYFTDLDLMSALVFSFFNSSQVAPFHEVDPSQCLSNNGATDCNEASNLGQVNGLFDGQTGGPDFLFQADANQSFVVQRAPEPGTLALLGAGLGLAGWGARRRAKKA
jgi:hypothetical protein